MAELAVLISQDGDGSLLVRSPGCVQLAFTAQEVALTFLHVDPAHASTRAWRERSATTVEFGPLPVSSMRCVQVSSQRVSLSAVNPPRPSPSRTKTSWDRKSSMAICHSMLSGVLFVFGISIPLH